MKTFAQILAALKRSQMWDWHRSGELAIFLDDVKKDRREVYRIRIPREKNRTPHVSLTVLCKFDPVKNTWNEYRHEDARNWAVESRRGEKALREYVAEIAQITKGYPNPEFLSYAEFSDGPKVREHREREAYYAKMEKLRTSSTGGHW